MQSKFVAANYTSSDAERENWPEKFWRAGRFVKRGKMCAFNHHLELVEELQLYHLGE